MSEAVFRTKTFPLNPASSVLFFVCPYGTTIAQLTWAIKRLQKDGFTVVAYDVSNRVIDGGDPTLLEAAVDGVIADIKKQIVDFKAQGASDFGFFGSSLGAFILYSAVAVVPELNWGVLNTGGDMAVGLWKLKKPRQRFEAAGIDLKKLKRLWQKVQYPEFKNLAGGHYLFFSSYQDKLAPLQEVDKFLEPLRQAGAQVDLLSATALGHVSTVTRGLLKCRQLVALVRSDQE